MTGRPDLGPQFDPDVVRLIEHVTIATRDDLWSEEVRGPLQASLRATYGRVPSLDDLVRRFGEELVSEIATRTVDERLAALREWAERNGHGSPCVFCFGPRRETDPFYPFGLARILEKETHWGGALAALAMNAVTLPLGFVVGARPGQTTRAHVAHCRLVMCSTCGAKCVDQFGAWIIKERECRYHPSWQRLVQAGYTTFLNHQQLARFR